MQHITEQTTRDFRADQYLVSVKANGGSVLVEIEHGDGSWIETDTISADFAGPMFFGFSRIRFTPSDGATLTLHTP